MDAINLDRILDWTNGSLAAGPGDAVVLRVSTDSRTVAPGDCFVALVGERFDGHEFIETAVRRGAKVVVYTPARYAPPSGDLGVRFVSVADTKAAFQGIARGYRSRFQIPVVGITGSNGKTTTKEMTAAMLAPMGEVVATEKNFNNDIGLPMTLLRIERHHAAAVVEMGMRGMGEIARLAEIALPTIGVVTNVGPVHIGLLKSIEGVARAKSELIRALPEEGTAVLNADDSHVAGMADLTDADVVTYGIEQAADVVAREIESLGLQGTEFTMVWPEGKARVRLPIPGRHHIYNALAGAAVARTLGLGIEAVKEGLASIRAAKMRTEVVELGSGVVLIDDAYNSSPLSAMAALAVLAEVRGKRRVAVLGDMLELGAYAPDAHRELGREAARAGVDALVSVGDFADHVARGAHEGDMDPPDVTVCPDAEAAARALLKISRAGDVVLVKGSRGVALEKVAEALKERWGMLNGSRGEAGPMQ